jgi:hypothetical protein
MDLHPTVVGIEHIRSDNHDSGSHWRRGDISARANAVVVAAVCGPRWLARRASRLIGGDDLRDQLSVLVGHVCLVEQVSFAWWKAQIDVDMAVVLVGYVGDRPGDRHTPVPHLESVLVVNVGQRIPRATASAEVLCCLTM